MKSPTRNKVTALKLGLSLAFMSGAACGANANEIVVSSGAERTDTADVSFSKLKISGTYTVTGQAQLKPDAGAIIELAPNEGDNAAVREWKECDIESRRRQREDHAGRR
mgnify:CR=1 FL=1